MVVATGGYVCFPVVVAARMLRALGLLRCGIALLEINVQPGSDEPAAGAAGRRGVDDLRRLGALLSAAKPCAPGRRCARRCSARSTRSRARLELGLAPERTTIVAMGGSQGARSINEAVAALVTRRTLGDDRQVLHVSGERDHAYMEAEERDVGAEPRRCSSPTCADPANAYAAADVVIARAGASTLAELAATGTPSILVPYPHAADDHQTSNAAVFAERGAAVVLSRRRARRRPLVVDARCDACSPTGWPKCAPPPRSLATSDVGRTIVSRIEFLMPARVVESGRSERYRP